MFPHIMRFAIGLALLAVSAVYALWRGGWPERSVALSLVAWFLVDQAFHAVFPDETTYVSVDIWHLALDVVALGLFVGIALVADRFWTLWLASAQLLAVVGHMLRLIDTGMHQFIYAVLIESPYWFAMIVLIYGTAREHAGSLDSRRVRSRARSNADVRDRSHRQSR